MALTDKGLSNSLEGRYLCLNNYDDTSGNGNDGTASGTSFVADRLGRTTRAIDYQSGDRVDLGSGWPTSNFTLSLWIKHDSVGVGRTIIGATTNGWTWYIYASNAMYFGGNGVDEVSLSYSETSTDWQHYTLTYDATNVRLYINGELESTTAYSTINSDLNQYLSGITGLTAFDGRHADVAIWSRVLSDTEIQQVYNGVGWTQ